MEFDEEREEKLKIVETQKYRYRECLKNHAVGMGRHAVDGCGEFMAVGEEGSLDALKCAACNCHRNFHRKVSPETEPYPHHHHHRHRFPTFSSFRPPPQLALPSTSLEEEEDISNPSSGSGSRKRFRTKFTAEQKEKMVAAAAAERMGWRIQKEDEAAVQQLCSEANVKRHVFKVWMHNNKNTLSKKKP